MYFEDQPVQAVIFEQESADGRGGVVERQFLGDGQTDVVHHLSGINIYTYKLLSEFFEANWHKCVN